MHFRQLDGELPQVRNLLSLKTVQVGLQGRRGVLQILSGSLQRILELHHSVNNVPDVHVSSDSLITGPTHLRDVVSCPSDIRPPRSFRIHIHHPAQTVFHCVE